MASRPPQPFPGDPTLTPDLWRQHHLDEDQQQKLVRELGRVPTHAELGVCSAVRGLFSEVTQGHPSAARLPGPGPRALLAGAGQFAIDLGGGLVAVLQGASRSGPCGADAWEACGAEVQRGLCAAGVRPVALRGWVSPSGASAYACGVARRDGWLSGRPLTPAFPIFYLGAPTAREGDEATSDPELSRRLLEACLDVHAEELVEGVQNVGAGGLAAAAVALALRAGRGIDLNLDLVPRKTPRMTPYEVLCSRSQDRVLLAVKRGREERILALSKKWDLPVGLFGRITDKGRLTFSATADFDPLDRNSVTSFPSTAGSLPLSLLRDVLAPSPGSPPSGPPSLRGFAGPQLTDEQLRAALDAAAPPPARLEALLHGKPVLPPGATLTAASVPTVDGHGSRVLALAVSDGNHPGATPYQAASLAVAEASRSLIAGGIEPAGLAFSVLHCLDDEPLALLLGGILEAAEALKIPVVGQETPPTQGARQPSSIVATLGVAEAEAQLIPPCFRAAGDAVVLLGVAGPFDLATETALQRLCLRLAREKKVSSMRSVASGGLLGALRASCLLNPDGRPSLGAEIDLPEASSPGDRASFLLGEAPSRMLATIPQTHLLNAEALVRGVGVPWLRIGTVGGSALLVRSKGEAICSW